MEKVFESLGTLKGKLLRSGVYKNEKKKKKKKKSESHVCMYFLNM